MLSENIWCLRLVKQLWPPDGCRMAEGRLSTSLAAKGFVLTTQQERIFKWIDPSEWWWKEERWTSRESLRLPAIGMWRYPLRTYKLLRVMFPVCKAPEPHPVWRIPALYYFRPKKSLGSWNLVNPLLSMNEAWMDECAANGRSIKTHRAPNLCDRKNSKIWS